MNEIVNQEQGIDALNSLIMGGDMSKLSPKQKLDYYHAMCTRAGLDPLSKPFDYMVLNGKSVLYANKGAAEQLRNIHGISITSMKQEQIGDIIVITVEGRNKEGRVDTEMGFAKIGEGASKLKGDFLGNAILKATTKAKRRLTLSMAGLGMLDETEVESIPGAKQVNAEIINEAPVNNRKHLEFFVQDPIKIQVPLKGDKPDWAAWARSYRAALEASTNEMVEGWVEENADAMENCKNDRPDIYEKLSAIIDERVAKVLDAQLMEAV